MVQKGPSSYIVFMLYVISILIYICDTRYASKTRHRTARDLNGRFNVLLNLYKINPLRKSQVFKAFADRILLPNKDNEQFEATHADTNESIRERRMKTKENFNEIEQAIHALPPQTRIKESKQPYYSVENTAPEEFSKEMSLKDLARLSLIRGKQNKNFFF